MSGRDIFASYSVPGSISILGEIRMKQSRGRDRSASKSFLPLILCLAVITVGVALYLLPSSSSSTRVSAQTSRGGQKRFKATKKIVLDRQTGQSRLPDEQELTKLVDDLQTLTQRSTEGFETQVAGGVGEAVNVDPGFGGTFVARPKEDGTMETRCVFSFEEAAQFLGLVEDNS